MPDAYAPRCLSAVVGRKNSMRYQLVLQFRGDTLADYDQMVALEDRLIADLGRSADVDGHDCGSGETNIFIFTGDPAGTFWRIRQTLKQQGGWTRSRRLTGRSMVRNTQSSGRRGRHRNSHSRDHPNGQAVAPANAGRASCLHSDTAGPAWLRWSLARRHCVCQQAS